MGGSSSKAAPEAPAPVEPPPPPPPKKKARVVKPGEAVYRVDDYWFHDLEAVRKKYPQDTYFNRLQLMAGGMSLRHFLTDSDKLERNQNLLKKQREAEQTGENSGLTEFDVLNAYRVVRWSSHDDGTYCPRSGRMVAFSVPMAGAMLTTVYNVMYPLTSAGQVFFQRTACHSMTGLGVALFSVHSSSVYDHSSYYDYGMCFVLPMIISGLTGFFGEYQAASVMQNVKLSFSQRYRIGGLHNIAIPSLGFAAAAYMAKAKEWSPSLFSDAGVPVYDTEGEVIDINTDVGAFASREAASLRLLQAASIGMLAHAYSTATTSEFWQKKRKVSRLWAGASHSAFKASLFVCGYIAALPLTSAVTPTQSTLASRRVSEDYGKKHNVPVVYYNRGL